MQGTIFDIQHCSVSDGPGVRTTVFLKGCPLHCRWCHNPESQSSKPQLMFYRHKCTACGSCLVCRARSLSDGRLLLDRSRCELCGRCVNACPSGANELCGRKASVGEIIAEVAEDKPFYRSDGGMTLSGGEPSMQPEFSLSLLRAARDEGIGCAIETCGFGEQSFFEEAASLGALFLFDLKAIDPELHCRLTGAPNGPIHENLERLFALGADIILRLPIIPGANDSADALEKMCGFLKSRSGKYRRAELIPYHALGVSKEEALDMRGESYSASDARRSAEAAAALFRPAGVICEIV